MLRELSLAFDAVIYREERAGQRGHAAIRRLPQADRGGTPIDILVFVGDNIMDFTFDEPVAHKARQGFRVRRPLVPAAESDMGLAVAGSRRSLLLQYASTESCVSGDNRPA
jgi:hypothetical protein